MNSSDWVSVWYQQSSPTLDLAQSISWLDLQAGVEFFLNQLLSLWRAKCLSTTTLGDGMARGAKRTAGHGAGTKYERAGTDVISIPGAKTYAGKPGGFLIRNFTHLSTCPRVQLSICLLDHLSTFPLVHISIVPSVHSTDRRG